MTQLQQILDTIGVKGTEPVHQITNIVGSIEVFAALNGNKTLEKECEDYIEHIVLRADSAVES